MYTLINNTCSYSFPIRTGAYVVCVCVSVIYTFEENNPEKGAYPCTYQMILYTLVWSIEINY